MKHRKKHEVNEKTVHTHKHTHTRKGQGHQHEIIIFAVNNVI
jgi:hypothetical protein